MGRSLLIALSLAITLVGAGCMRTARARDTRFAGFLDNYGQLERGGRDEPVYEWRRPDADLDAYDRLVLAPVVLYGDEATSALSSVERRNLLEYFYNSLYIALSPDFLMIDDPEPGAVRLEVAVTGVGARHALLDTASGLTPLGIASTEVVWVARGKAPFTGELAIEFRLTDCATGRTLWSGADRRVGGRWLAKGFDKWADAYAAIDAYADAFRSRLQALRGADGSGPLAAAR